MVLTDRHTALPSPDGLISDELRHRIERATRKELISETYPYPRKMGRTQYEAEKRQLQIELLQVQRWV